MLLGLHLSVRQGFLRTLSEAEGLGIDLLQLLPCRRHDWPTPEETAAFRLARARSGVARVIAHSRFVPAPASSDPERRGRSVARLARELSSAEALGADAYVLHPGAYSPGSDPEEGLAMFVRTIEDARAESGASLPLLIENVPGGGRRMGGPLDEFARIVKAVTQVWPGTRACIDTAHAWGAGYDLSGSKGMGAFLEAVDRTLGGSSVALWHFNDSRAPRGSGRDDHWHLGEGAIGVEGLATLAAALSGTPAAVVIETPPGERDARNVEWLREATGMKEQG